MLCAAFDNSIDLVIWFRLSSQLGADIRIRGAGWALAPADSEPLPPLCTWLCQCPPAYYLPSHSQLLTCASQLRVEVCLAVVPCSVSSSVEVCRALSKCRAACRAVCRVQVHHKPCTRTSGEKACIPTRAARCCLPLNQQQAERRTGPLSAYSVEIR